MSSPRPHLASLTSLSVSSYRVAYLSLKQTLHLEVERGGEGATEQNLMNQKESFL